MSALPILQFPQGDEDLAGDVLTEVEEDSFRRRLSDQSSFDDGYLTFGELTLHVADILKELDPQAYSSALISFRNEREGQLADLVTQAFPGPIAYSFYMFVNGWENQHERLQFLRDTWEALVRFAHAVVISEVRSVHLNLQGSELKFSHLFSDSISRILDNIEAIQLQATTQKVSLASCNIFNGEFIERLRSLNQTRNKFSHSQSLSSNETAQLIDETIEEFFPLLWDLELLRETQLMRVTALEGNQLRVQSFNGYAQLLRTNSLSVTTKTIANSLSGPVPQFVPQHLLVSHADHFFCLAPFVHFITTGTGRHPKVLLLKKAQMTEDKRVLVFETVGESQPLFLDRSEFKPYMDDLRTCFGLGEDA